MRKLLFLTRGLRLGPLFRAIADTLAPEFHVVVVSCYPGDAPLWANAPHATFVDLAEEIPKRIAASPRKAAELAREIEAETGLTVYKAASNYLLYRRFSLDYFGSWDNFYGTDREMLEEYVGSYLILKDLFETHRPELVFHEALDLIPTMTCFVLARRAGVFNLGMVFGAGLGDAKVFLYYGLARQNLVMEHLLRRPERITPANREAAKAVIAKARGTAVARFSHVETWRERAGGGTMRRLPALVGHAIRARSWQRPRHIANRLARRRWCDRHFRRDIPEGPFVLFLLHRQPEASTSSQAPRWVDQERIIEQMAINAPHGMRIVVKENPQSLGLRGVEYFGHLERLPNVHLCHPAVDTPTLLRRMEALVTITGSAGLEAVLMGKRVAVLGRPYYAAFSGVRQIAAPDEIWPALADPSWDPARQEDELETFVAAYVQSVIDIGPVEKGKIWPAPEIGGRAFARGLRDFLGLTTQDGLRPADFPAGMDLK
ncbi:MAG: hypothetical protein FJX47_06025 [Alphaproteobacteria bacterium]|nr:hypothetical protein [Alphaproteobacteria bacterium]